MFWSETVTFVTIVTLVSGNSYFSCVVIQNSSKIVTIVTIVTAVTIYISLCNRDVRGRRSEVMLRNEDAAARRLRPV